MRTYIEWMKMAGTDADKVEEMARQLHVYYVKLQRARSSENHRGQIRYTSRTQAPRGNPPSNMPNIQRIPP